ncbi:DNA repair protein [Thraustotheca clavata]|uniref:DNA repair protein n=1 Tax=Thraustotheca clavata TaxID=74557 RepID=A0A1W0A9T4_9STRA|nr:DNA repair protein [Thraustotheca clavata]
MSNSCSLRSWNELYYGEWLHVDACRNLIDQPLHVEKLRGRGSLMPFIVAFEQNGNTIDIAKKYATSWSKTQTLRTNFDENWYTELLGVGQSASMPIEIDIKAPMPTTTEQFKNHPQYCLEKQIGVFQYLYPRKAVGLFKGIPVFSRKHVQILRTKHQWRRKGRIVQEQEEPIKRIARKQNRNVFPPRLENTLSLFGQWQTIVYEPPALIDGIIPKNEHGNIEIWTPNDVPIGGVHIRLTRVQKVAKELGIDYAPAVVGFEVKGGRNVAVIDGIVVAQHFETMIQDAHATMEQDLIEKAIKRNRQIIIKRWSMMVQKLLLRKRLQEEYSTGQ